MYHCGNCYLQRLHKQIMLFIYAPKFRWPARNGHFAEDWVFVGSACSTKHLRAHYKRLRDKNKSVVTILPVKQTVTIL